MLYFGLGDATLRITGFEWDDANIEHLARHNVGPDEAEQVLQNRPVVRRSRSGRYVAIGQTDEGRYLVVVFEVRRGGRTRVVTARPAQSEERRLYSEGEKLMARKTQEKPLPAFESAEEEAAFWDAHSVADYWDQLEPVNEPVEVVRKKRLLSVRLAQQDMEALRRAAARYGLGAGTLARVWILERLRAEKAQQP